MYGKERIGMLRDTTDAPIDQLVELLDSRDDSKLDDPIIDPNLLGSRSLLRAWDTGKLKAIRSVRMAFRDTEIGHTAGLIWGHFYEGTFMDETEADRDRLLLILESLLVLENDPALRPEQAQIWFDIALHFDRMDLLVSLVAVCNFHANDCDEADGPWLEIRNAANRALRGVSSSVGKTATRGI